MKNSINARPSQINSLSVLSGSNLCAKVPYEPEQSAHRKNSHTKRFEIAARTHPSAGRCVGLILPTVVSLHQAFYFSTVAFLEVLDVDGFDFFLTFSLSVWMSRRK